MQKTISGFLLPAHTYTNTHTHTPSSLYRAVFLTFFVFSIPSLIRNKIKPHFGGYHTRTPYMVHLAGRRDLQNDGGTVIGMSPALAQHLASPPVHSLFSFTAVQCPGATDVTKAPPGPSSCAVRVGDSCVNTRMQ